MRSLTQPRRVASWLEPWGTYGGIGKYRIISPAADWPIVYSRTHHAGDAVTRLPIDGAAITEEPARRATVG